MEEESRDANRSEENKRPRTEAIAGEGQQICCKCFYEACCIQNICSIAFYILMFYWISRGCQRRRSTVLHLSYACCVPWIIILISFMKDRFLELTQTWISHCLVKKDCHVWSRWVFFEFQVYKSTQLKCMYQRCIQSTRKELKRIRYIKHIANLLNLEKTCVCQYESI